MEKIPVHIIISKNKEILSQQCSLWYIPYCPVEIENIDKWYNQISKFIDTHTDIYNIIHIPDNIYNDNYSDSTYNTQNNKINHLFIVGIGDTSSLLPIYQKPPEGYHVAYCLKHNAKTYDIDNIDKNNHEKSEDIILDIAFKAFLTLFVGFTIYLFGFSKLYKL